MQTSIHKKFGQVLASQKTCEQAFGVPMAKQILRRLDQARAANPLTDLRNAPGKWHELKYDKKYQIAVHLIEPARMIFEVDNLDQCLKEDGCLDWGKVNSISLVAIEKDYHKNKNRS